MRFAKYWAKGSYEGVVCFRPSDRSLADAKSIADDAARSLFERIKQGLIDQTKRGGYGYSNGPLREELLTEVSRDGSELTAAITRNAYGCSVLNCADTLFVDIDLEEQPQNSSGGFLSKLFGKKEAAPTADPREDALKRIEDAVSRNGDSARVYATKAGIRVLFTNKSYSPTGSETHQIFEMLGADPLYVRLCKQQESFRARLTPKPWRLSILTPHPPTRWPWVSPEAEEVFIDWLKKYESASQKFATCAHLKTIGSKTTSAIAKIVALHDEKTKASSGLPLA